MFEFLDHLFTFPNRDAFNVVQYAFTGFINQFDEFIANLPFIAITMAAFSTVLGLGVSIVRKISNNKKEHSRNGDGMKSKN